MKLAKEFFRRITRKKFVDLQSETQLKKCLGLFDLTALGVGSTLGVGIYILAGQISKDEAGPGVTMSFLVAAIASIFAGLCYAEFGARVPKAGSAYIYSYVCVGEFIAFVIGWSMLLSYGIGASSVAKGFTKNLNSITNGWIDNILEYFWIGENTAGVFDKNVDVFSFIIIILLTLVLSCGVKESTILNNLLTVVNISVVFFIFIAGGIYADIGNWHISEESIHANFTDVCQNCSEKDNQCFFDEYDTNCGGGGFFPYGFKGVIQGAGTAFYGFVGFDVIATVGEEVINPKRDIPLSIVLALTSVFISYFGISSVVTLCLPYFLQDSEAPLPNVFHSVGLDWATWIIQVGAFFGLFASLLGALIPLPRVIWAMASDGLIFKTLARVNERFQTPLIATMVSGTIAAMMAAIFNLRSLVDLMSIGTLLGYTMVSACVLILRYFPTKCDHEVAPDLNTGTDEENQNLFALIFNTHGIVVPTYKSAYISETATWAHGVLSVVISLVIMNFSNSAISIALITISLFGIALIILVLSRQPHSREFLDFQVPFVPYLPLASIFINSYLMVNLGPMTWAQFAVYLCLGLAIYFFYGVRNSIADQRIQTKKVEVAQVLDQEYI